MNELSNLENGNKFLKISSLLFISTFVYDFIIIFFNIDVNKKIKTFIKIQIVADYLIIVLEIIAFFFLYNNKIIKFF